jgi:ABC-type branched-subunit amino acid transport system ATPase component
MSAFLEVQGASKAFGGVRAVDGMDFSVDERSICGVIGPNGSGKTTLLGLLSGTYRPDRGSIRLKGHRLDGLSAHRTVQEGVARTFQTSRLFFRWTLLANLVAAAAARPMTESGDADPERLLALVGLTGRGEVLCLSLSNAEQRLAMIAVAMATRPHLLLLDEPAVGMSPSETGALGGVIRRIRDERGVTVVIVEHNMHFMMGLADRIMAMNAGRKLAEGTPAEVRGNPDVIAAYLGT